MKRPFVTLTLIVLCFLSRPPCFAAIVAVEFGTGVFFEIDNFDGAVLSGGLPTVDHDGTVVQLGYYPVLPGGFLIWTPLTGEGSANTDYANSTIGDDADVQIGDGMFDSIWGFTIGSPTTGRNLPSVGTPLRVRFYNAKSLAASTYYLEVFNPSWLWPTPGEPGSGQGELVTSLDDGGTKVVVDLPGHAIDLQHTNFRIRTNIEIPVIPEPTVLALLATAAMGLSGSGRPRERKGAVSEPRPPCVR